MLSTGAFNALLKTLEEPPAHVIFILATTEVHKLPATILSRCQRFDFKRIQPETMSIRLKQVAELEGMELTTMPQFLLPVLPTALFVTVFQFLTSAPEEVKKLILRL